MSDESIHEFKMKAFKRMRKLKRDMDWCSDFDEILSEIGLNNAIPEYPTGSIVRHPRHATVYARRDTSSRSWRSTDPYRDEDMTWDEVVKDCEMHPVLLSTPDNGSYGYTHPEWDAD